VEILVSLEVSLGTLSNVDRTCDNSNCKNIAALLNAPRALSYHVELLLWEMDIEAILVVVAVVWSFILGVFFAYRLHVCAQKCSPKCCCVDILAHACSCVAVSEKCRREAYAWRSEHQREREQSTAVEGQTQT
jgi:hypothetical protein